MKTQFQKVIQDFSFLSPYHTGQLDITVSYLKERNLLLDFTVSPNAPSFTAEGVTKNIHLKKYMFPENYIAYEFSETILQHFYHLVDTKGDKYDLSELNIKNLDDNDLAASKLINRIISILSSYKRCDNFNTIIVSPSILSYFYSLHEFYPTNVNRFDSRMFDYNRFAKVGTLFNRMDVYVDNTRREDFILMGTCDKETLRLYYSWNNCARNQINIALEDVCYDFKEKFVIFKDIKYKDPMETDVTNFNTDNFFYNDRKVATN